jgi:CheY-like chemotaxis protein
LDEDAKKSHYLETINTSGQALLRLINDILDLSRIESGKMELQEGAVSMVSLCNELKGLFAMKIKEKGLTFHYHLEDIPSILTLDEARMRQVLINLVGNAIKFTHQGTVNIEMHCQAAQETPETHIDLTLVVTDTGIGIPKDQQEKVFHSFEQVTGQNETLYGGTGLGLAITLKIVSLMKGNIHLESQEGVGTAFHLTIPNVEVVTSETTDLTLTTNVDTEQLTFSPATLLVVDDVDYNREILENYLLEWGFELHFACNGQQACEKARALLPDLILLDMKMPIMNGYEAANTLKNDALTAKIPIIAITAFALNRDEEVISQLCEGYLRKPVNRNELIRKLLKFLPHSQQKNKTIRQETKTNIETLDVKTELSQLSDELRASLKQAIEQIDIEALETLQTTVLAQNEPLAKVIQRHIDEFQYEELLILFG